MNTTVYQDPRLGAYTLTVLDCGLSVYIMEKPGFSSSFAVFGTKYGSIDTKFRTDAGDFTEVPEGIAHFLEHKLFESEEGDAFTRFAATGAYANAFTSFDRTCYLFSCSSRFYENLDILLDFVQSPYFTAQTVQKEQGIIGQEIRMYEDSPGWRVMFNMLEAMYENHPVKIDIAGTVDSIAKIDDKLLYECYNTFYNLSNMYICIAGNVRTDEVLDRIKSGIKNDRKVCIERGAFRETGKVLRSYVEQKFEVAQPMFCFGYKETWDTPQRTAEERVTAGILLELLCGDCSPLYKRLTDSGLINDEFSSEYFQGNGYATILFEGESSDPKAVADAIDTEIQRILREGVDERLLEAAKKSAYGDAVRRFDSTENIVMDMIDCAVCGGDLFDTVGLLEKITPEDILARLRLLKKESSVLSVILPTDEKEI